MRSITISWLGWREVDSLRVPEKGCALCEATWGDDWEDEEGQRMFLCCDICAVEFKNMIREIKDQTGCNIIDEIKMTDDYGGRDCNDLWNSEKYRVIVSIVSRD